VDIKHHRLRAPTVGKVPNRALGLCQRGLRQGSHGGLPWGWVKVPNKSTWFDIVTWRNREVCQAKNRYPTTSDSRLCLQPLKVVCGIWPAHFRPRLGGNSPMAIGQRTAPPQATGRPNANSRAKQDPGVDIAYGSDGRDSHGYVPDDGIETLPPGLPLPDPDRTGIERGPATQVV
jgi:hypothetical protein